MQERAASYSKLRSRGRSACWDTTIDTMLTTNTASSTPSGSTTAKPNPDARSCRPQARQQGSRTATATLLLADDLCELRASVVAVVAGQVSGGFPFAVLRDRLADVRTHEWSPICERCRSLAFLRRVARQPEW